MKIEEIISKLGEKLTPHRLEHSIGVMDTAVIMAKRFGADVEKARLAGILHDCAKYIEENEGYRLCKQWDIKLDEVCTHNYAVVHQYLGAKIASSEYGVNDKEIISAIECHATGKRNMSKLEKIIYIADMTEPSRLKKPYEGLYELCDMCEKDLDKAVLMGLELSMKHITETGKLIHLDTVDARNSLILKIHENKKI